MLLSILYIIGITVEAMRPEHWLPGRRQMDTFGVIIIASVTAAIGGGSVRDILCCWGIIH